MWRMAARGSLEETGPDTARWEDDSPTEPHSFPQVCADCGGREPPEGAAAPLPALSGWCFSRRRSRDGSFVAEWRCQPCWRVYKARRAAAGTV
jgi:hypothetical protein